MQTVVRIWGNTFVAADIDVERRVGKQRGHPACRAA